MAKRLPKFGPNAVPGIFLGWNIHPGGRWKGEYNNEPEHLRGHGQGDLNWYTNGWLREQIAARQRDGEKLLAALDEYEEACA